jgi:hypothetical protein
VEYKTKNPIHATHTDNTISAIYHSMVLGIFRPFVVSSELMDGEQVMSGEKLSSFWSPDSYPASVYFASINQIKQLVQRYSSNYPQELHTIFLNVALSHIAYASLKYPRDPESRVFFLLCVRYWQDLYVNYTIFSDILRAYLYMAVQSGMLTLSEGQSLLEEMRARRPQPDITEDSVSSFLVDLDLAMTSPDKAEAQALAERFDDMFLFADLTMADSGDTTFSAESISK